MKKGLCVVLLFALLILAISITAIAGQEKSIEIIINEANVIEWEPTTFAPGSECTIPLDVYYNSGVALLVVTLEYDTDIFTLVKAENGVVFEDMDQGINLMWSSDEDSTAVGNLANLTFKIAEDAPEGNYGVTLNIRECYDSEGNWVSTGIIHSDNIYVVSNTPTIDIDMDGELTVRDAEAILKVLEGYDVLIDNRYLDVNGDGEVNIRDAATLLLYVEGKIDQLN